MATFKSDVMSKRLRHRGVYEGKTQVVSGFYRLKPGQTIATTDLIEMVPLGENVRPNRVIVGYRKVSGTPTLTGGTVSIGVAPAMSVDFNRPTGQTYPALTASATALSASSAATLTANVSTDVAAPPSTNTKWGPFIVTAKPTAALSVAGGEVDLFVHVEYDGEHNEADPVYSTFSA